MVEPLPGPGEVKDGRLEQSQKILSDILVVDPGNKDAESLLEEVEHNITQISQAGVRI